MNFDDYMKSIGAEQRSRITNMISIWDWPHEANGSKYDQILICREFSDGSYDIAMSMQHRAGGKFSTANLRALAAANA